MKTKYTIQSILWLMLTVFYCPLHATVYNLNQPSGTVSVHETYVNNMYDEWNINIGVGKAVKLVYNTDLETCCDYVRIYDVDNSGNLTQLAALVGAKSGTVYTITPNGKVKITFTTDGSVNYQSGYTGFDIQFSEDNRYQINDGLNVTGDAHFNDDVIVSGSAIFNERVGIGVTPSPGYKVNVYNNNQDNTGFRTYTYKNSSSSIYGMYSAAYNYSGPVYGIYSYVSGGGTDSKRWAGYFSGGDVEISSGNLRVSGNIYGASNGKIRMNGIIYGNDMLTFLDDARFTVTTSEIPNLRDPSFSMTHYGIATPPTTGSADLWISGNNNIRMFTAGNPTPRMSISYVGYVGIGTSNPQYLLDVKGTIRTTEVLVQSVDQFADFVFDKDYRLPGLNEVQSFIRDNGHLPGIPSAQEVKENGMSLVEMQVKLLQKIEELTLYVIEQQEIIDRQNAKIEVLEQKVK